MALYTFFVEVQGSTILEQFHGGDVEEAAKNWNEHSSLAPQLQPEHLTLKQGIVVVTDCTNVWCLSAIAREDCFVLVHIVLTESMDKLPRSTASQFGSLD